MSLIGSLCKCLCILILPTTILLLLLSSHLQQSFPQSLKHIQPQTFISHPYRDLSSQIKILQQNKNQYNHINNQLISSCQDFQISTSGQIYCVNEHSQILTINPNNNQTSIIYTVKNGLQSYGCRLSRDQKILYFINSELGLCMYNIQTNQFQKLLSTYNNQQLLSLNSIQTHPNNSNILYLTQSTTKLPMYLHTIEILLNNPFGRVFQYNIQKGQLTLIADGLYFPNGIVYQVNSQTNQPSLLIAQTNRHRVSRVYLQGKKRGEKQVVIDNLDIFVDNMKLSSKGQLWVAGPTTRDALSPIADRTPLLRKIISRLPPAVFPHLTNTIYFGGVKVTFDKKNNTKYSVQYYLYNKLPNFTFVTTLVQKDNKLFMSSLGEKGLFVVNLQNTQNQNVNQQKSTQNEL